MDVRDDYIVQKLTENAELYEQLGTKEKFWFRDLSSPDSQRTLFKYSRPNTGEHWSEKCAEQLCELLEIPHVKYDIAIHDDRYGVVSPNIVDKNEHLVMGNELLNKDDPDEYPAPVDFADNKQRITSHTVTRVLAFLYKSKIQPPKSDFDLNGLDAAGVFCGYLMLDALISNQDRHHENWAVIVEAMSGSPIFRLCPTYDHAASMGRELLDKERRERLTTKDRNRSVEQFVQKAQSQLYKFKADKKPMKTLDAFIHAVQKYPLAKGHWLSKLDFLTEAKIKRVFDRIPPDLLSEVGREFAYKVVIENRKRLLKYYE
ncbi:MAG: hypothetical protein ACTH58_17005 [Marinomonas foliarum]|uniref:hypothetical protein n=1 Tax=Marinomonas foliarum TaxID=491950 RepID=UPI003F974547